MRMAEAYIRVGLYARAVETLNGIADRTARWHYYYAVACTGMGDYDAARALYGTLGDARQVMACAYRQAEALEAAGDLTAARDGFLSAAG